MSYYFSVRFINHKQEEDFINLEMITQNQKNVKKYIPTGASKVEVFNWSIKPLDWVSDYKEAAEECELEVIPGKS